MNSTGYFKLRIISLLYFYKNILMLSFLLGLLYITFIITMGAVELPPADQVMPFITNQLITSLTTWGFFGGVFINHRLQRSSYPWYRNLHWKIPHLILFSYFFNILAALVIIKGRNYV